MHTGRSLRRTLALLSAALAAPMLAGWVAAGPAVAASGPMRPATSAQPVAMCPRVPHRMSCMAEQAPGAGTTGGRHPAGAVPGYGPADLASAYQIPRSTSTETVAVIDAYDSATVEQDLATYRAYYGLPPCTPDDGCFRKVNQDGAPSPLPPAPPSDARWQAETALDVEMVSAVCPTCHLLLVEAADDDRSGQPNLEAAASKAAVLGAHYVSMSWGEPEFADEQGADSDFLSAPGVAYVAAAGDTSYGTSWPAADPNVVSVGGTSLWAANNARGWNEIAWGYTNGEGTGSGCSSYEPQPGWQNAAPVNTLCAHRAMNDVSIVGDPHTGVSAYQGGQWNAYGGTSAGAPMIAALYAMAGAAGSGIPAAAYPYGHPGAFTDITANANAYCGNALCTAGPGWDGPTGVGTPRGLSGFSPVQPNIVAVRDPGSVTSYIATRAWVDTRASDTAGLPLTYTAAGLPPGTAIGSDGIIGGTPLRTGSYAVTVTAADRSGAAGSTAFRWIVGPHHISTSYPPRLSGALRRGHLVYAAWGAFRQDTPRGAVIRPYLRVQWYLDGRAIRGATHTWFTIPWNDRGHRLQVVLSAYASNYTSYGYVTGPSAPIG